jgi:DNA (cytosine-5)-methyltransferase 1
MTDLYHDIEPYCCSVLRHRIAQGDLPDGTVIEGDIKELRPDQLEGYRQIHLFAGIGGFALGLANAGFSRPILTAGFPCQDISLAGKGAGIDGDRSVLWWETLAAINVVRPPVVLLENVAALLRRGVDTVLGSLASVGYDAQWHCVPAAYVGALHRRDRIWIVAHPSGQRRQQESRSSLGDEGQNEGRAEKGNNLVECDGQSGGKGDVADAERKRGRLWNTKRENAKNAGEPSPSADAGRWAVEPNVGRVAHGIPKRVDRLRGLGNAVVPQVVEFIIQHIEGGG